MKRTPLTRKTPLKAKPSRRLSPERPLAVWCELRLDGCLGVAAQRHERLRRSHGGTGNPGNTLDLCSACHGFVHANPALAYEQGWMVRSGT